MSSLELKQHVAIRDEPDHAASQEVTFIGPPGRRLLCMIHLPLRAASAGVVVCSPLGAEHAQNQRRELALARDLARRGLAVIRFHYRSTGDSDGHSHALTVESMIADTSEAVRALIERTGAPRFAFLGTRVGALVAAAAASGHSAAPLALWEPAVDTERYLEEIARYRAIQEMLRGERSKLGTGASLAAEIEQDGAADLLGFPLAEALFAGLRARRITDDLAGPPRSVLLVQLRRQRALVAEYEEFEKYLLGRGHRVTSRRIKSKIVWWFLAGDSAGDSTDSELIAATADWLVDELGA